MDTQDAAPITRPDGRLQRSERSRQAIVVAMLELVEEGNLVPSTRREAAEAIVSFENWQRLRQHQKLSRNSTVQIAADMLALLISQDISPAKT